MFKLNIIDKISFILVIIGAINWGSIGLFNINLLYYLTNGTPLILRFLYILVLLAAIDLIYLLFKAKVFRIKLK